MLFRSAFAHSEVLPVHHYGQSQWTALDDEDVAQTLQAQLLSHTKGHYITASDVVNIVAGSVMQETFLHSGISHSSISDCTARRWLQCLSWHYGPMRNGMYIDGHERKNVVDIGMPLLQDGRAMKSDFTPETAMELNTDLTMIPQWKVGNINQDFG